MPLTLAWPACSPATGGGVDGSVCHSASASAMRNGKASSNESSRRRMASLRDLTSDTRIPAPPEGNVADQATITERRTQSSGFFIDRSDIVLTSRHVVADAGEI